MGAGRPGEGAPAAFSTVVQREMGRVEALLKTVGSRPDTLIENFRTLLPTGTAADFQRILDLKARCTLNPHRSRCSSF